MSRYIDADAAIKRFEELQGNENTLLNSYNADWIVSFIEGQPTADVQEVRHGRWSNFLCYNTCSRCGRYVHEYDDDATIQDFAFCPYCGAKMDEDERE